MAFTEELIEGGHYLLKMSEENELKILEDFTQIKVEKISFTKLYSKINFLYLSNKPVSKWVKTRQIKKIIIDKVIYPEEVF